MPKIPDNLKRATNYDLLDPKGKVLPGVKFYVHGYHPEVLSSRHPDLYPTPDDVPLEEHITKKDTDLEKWKEWMDDGRIYVESKVFKAQSSLNYI